MSDDAPIAVVEAQRRILAAVGPTPAERIGLGSAFGRTLAAPLRSRLDLPPWDNSAMDGYAVRSAEVDPDSELPVALDVPAGAPAGEGSLPTGAAAKIMTGAPLPGAADAIVPVESSAGPAGAGVFAAIGERVRFRERPAPGAHVRRRGEDVRRGDVVLEAGTRLGAAQIALAAATGHAMLSVHRRPRVAIVSTGDELVDPGEAGDPDRIVNSNAWGVAAQVVEVGGDPVVQPIARDRPEEIAAAVDAALAADAAVTIGGVSAGERDLVRERLDRAGARLLVERVAIKPGGPFAFGSGPGGRPVFALPGNPVSALVTFELFARPALLAMTGRRDRFRRPIPARLAEPVEGRPDRAVYVRARLEPDGRGWRARSAGGQGSNVLSALAAAHGLVVVPAGVDVLAAGSEVDVLPLGEIPLVGEPA